MNVTTRSASAMVLWSELQDKEFLKTWSAYNSDMGEAMKQGYIIFGCATDEALSAKLDRKNRWGGRQDFVHDKGQDEVKEDVKALRSLAKKLGWSIKQAHKSWEPSYGVTMWVLHPTDERDENGTFFRNCGR